MKKDICFVLGTRPEIIKLSPLIKLLKKESIPYFIIHTGQHFDYSLDSVFFKELCLDYPTYNLAVKAEMQGAQTGRMIEEIEKILISKSPSIVVVQGDTNSGLAGTLAAVKLHIPVAHVEAGLRSYDKSMSEEVNRIIIDHISSVLFVPTEDAKKNLIKEGVKNEHISVTGNTVVEALSENMIIAEQRSLILTALKLEKKKYILLTIHRQENVDNKERLENIISALELLAHQQQYELVCSMHPRTKKMLIAFGINMPSSIITMDPVGYFDFLQLEKNAAIIMTDSGGLQEEACILNVPCITLRDNTERPETVACGANRVVGTDKDNICKAVASVEHNPGNWQQPFGKDGFISTKMKQILMKF